MRILIDGVIFENSRQRGAQRYTRELLSRVGRQCEVQIWLEKRPAVELPAHCTVHYGLPRTWRNSLPSRLKWRWRVARQRRAWEACDVFHTTYLSPPPIATLPAVVTILDLIPQRFPDMCERWGDGQARDCEDAVKRSDAIITISQATADDLVAMYPEVKPRVTPILLGADHLLGLAREPLLPHADMPAGLSERPFAMFVGDRGSYKNFRTLLEAVAHPEFPKGLLLAVAGPEWRFTEEMLMRSLGISDRVIHCGRVSDAVLAALYRQCRLAVVPALIEGFGFPVLEAQSAGAPVACSDIPIFRELMGNSAAYFDPRLASALARTIAELMEESTAGPLRQAGLDNVRRYTWDSCAARTLEVYAKLARK